ncbi:MAG: nickel-dependent hydrogenase large subunit [Solirubrobacteraceae bacterium]
MSRHIVVDPISRIEGQLRIEAVLDDSNTITTAYSAGTMFRGIELILQGRDPRDAGLLAMRICGVCTGVHYWTSIRAVEDAFHLTLTKNARLVRNLIQASLFMHDHPVHFYQLHALDWVDLVSSLSADPKKAVDVAYSYSDSPYNASLATYQAVQQKLTAFVKAGSLGIFGNAYWGSPSYELTPEQNLVAVSHYLDALTIQRTAAKMMAILGGKNPHPQSIVVGGITSVEDIQNPAELALFGQYLSEVTQFVQTAYLPDLLMVGTVYAKQGLDGIGAGLKSYMAYGDFSLTDAPDSAKLFSRGLVLDGDLSKVYPVDQANVREDITHSWYEGDWNKHPYVEETVPDYTGLDKRSDGIAYLKTDAKYSWLKAPTYDGYRVEVGPLARLVVGYASGNQTIVQHVDALLKLTGFPASVLFSTLGRTAARCVETMIIADAMVGWLNELQLNVASGDTTTWTDFDFGNVSQDTEGVGMSEAPRGALAHWVVIKDGQIDNYQAVVPTTWNASPRDAQGRPGAYEASLVGVKLANPQEPLEILRTIHSFDPCLACAVHLVDARGREISSCEVVPSGGVPMA